MNTKTLLQAGVVAGPIFIVVVVAQLLTRDGFDIMHHPISLLSLGAAGWVQIANFVVAGLLCCAFAAGLSRVLTTGPGSTWGSRLIALYGVGLVAGGVFTPDPALGYPVGTPDAIPQAFTWHAMVHAVAPPLAFTALVFAALVMARRFRTAGRRGWALYSAVSGLVALVITAWPDQDTASWRLAIGVVVGYAWLTAFAIHERASLLNSQGTWTAMEGARA
jgi:hypothetical membrane protein